MTNFSDLDKRNLLHLLDVAIVMSRNLGDWVMTLVYQKLQDKINSIEEMPKDFQEAMNNSNNDLQDRYSALCEGLMDRAKFAGVDISGHLDVLGIGFAGACQAMKWDLRIAVSEKMAAVKHHEEKHQPQTKAA